MTEVNPKQGENIRWVCTYNDSTGAPVDLTGATVSSSALGIATQTLTDFAVSITGAASGQFEISASKNVTAQMPVGLHKTDILVDWPDASRSISATWYFEMKGGVTP